MEYVNYDAQLDIKVDKVLSIVYVAKNSNAVVAVLTEPIFLKSERDEIAKKIAQKAKEQLGFTEVKVTFSAQAYARIQSGLSYEKALLIS